MSLIDLRDEIELLYGSPLSVISDCLRGFIVPESGHDFIVCDYASIEARVLCWLAGDTTELEIFKTHGLIYEYNAAKIYRKPMENITKDERQIGKVAVLSLGYGGGKGAFKQMAKNYGVHVTDDRAEEIKTAWRDAHPQVVKFWYALNDAAIKAVKFPGRKLEVETEFTSVYFKVSGSFLWCQLPSKRTLCYPYPKVENLKEPFEHQAVTYMGEDTFTRKWSRLSTYGGKLAENITQAVSRDLLVDAMLRLEERNYPVVLHVHDEIVCEVKCNYGSVEEMSEIMCASPAWAKGLPVAAEGWRGDRYRK